METTESLDHESSASPLADFCNLPSKEREARAAVIRRDILPLATNREDLADGVRLDFDFSESLEKTLEELVAFEQVCCSGLTWDVKRSASSTLSLSVSGIPANSRFFESLQIQDGGPQPKTGFVRRLAGSLGIGTTAAAFICCVTPMALAAIAGVSIAAPFAKLDNPLTIAGGSLALAVPAWFWLKRRSARSECDC